MNTLDYKCKFCGSPGHANYDPSCPLGDLDKWRRLLACNRCADFETVRRRLVSAMVRYCATVYRARQCEDKGLAQVESSTRESLIRLSRKFATVISDFLRSPNVWSEDFVNVLMERPECADRSLSFYFASRRKHAAQPLDLRNNL